MSIMKAKVTLAMNTLMRECGVNFTADASRGCGVAYLLGRETVRRSLVLLPYTKRGEEVVYDQGVVHDFFGNFEEMSSAIGYCGQEEFVHAYALAMGRMESVVQEEGEGLGQQLASLNNSARKSVMQSAQKSGAGVVVQPAQKKEGKKSVYSVEEVGENALEKMMNSAEKEEKQQPPVETIEMNGCDVTSPMRGDDSLDSDSSMEVDASEMTWVEMYDQLKTSGWCYKHGVGLIDWVWVHPSHANTPVSELLKNYEEGEDYVTSENELKLYAMRRLGWKGDDYGEDNKGVSRSKRSRQKNEALPARRAVNSPLLEKNNPISTPAPAESAFSSWPDMWDMMKTDGWIYKKGPALIDWIWIHPSKADMKMNDLMKQGTVGVDYVTSEEDLMRYAKTYYGWRGIVESPESSKEAEMADRIKKRKRRESSAKAEAAAPVTEPTRKNVGKGKSRMSISSGGKQLIQMNRAALRNSPATSATSDVSDASRFSDGAPSEQSESCRTRSSVAGSPTVSEMEFGFGSTPSAKKRTAPKRLSYGKAGRNRSGRKKTEEEEESAESTSGYSETSASGASTSSGSSGSAESSVDATYQIMANKDAWLALMKLFGFTFASGKYYCLPGKENKPGSESKAVEGVHYFSSLEELRKNLCAYGLPTSKKALLDEERVDIERWVRYAHVANLPDGGIINPAHAGEPINHMQAWGMLQKLGFKHSSGGYKVQNPDITKNPLKFERQQDFYVHLARFGIPRVDGASELSQADRLTLDLFICNPGVENVNTL